MPCDQVITVSIDVSKFDHDILRKVLEELALRNVVVENGKLVGREDILTEETLKKIKTAYVKRAIQEKARKWGWKVLQDKQNTQKFKLLR
jgi:hypothetical protein